MPTKGVLLVNLGSPESYKVKDVRRYLGEFLMDSRVIDIPPLWRRLLVWGIIVPFRSPKSALLYKKIWRAKSSSPLLYYSNLQLQLLKMELGEGYQVELAMRYQYPSIKTALNKLKQNNVSSIQVIPLFPQYASATSGSVIAKVMQETGKWGTIPQLTITNSFYNNPHLIAAYAARGKKYLTEHYDHILFSFHGLPESHLKKCDQTRRHCLANAGCCSIINELNQHCYGAQCYHTAALIARQLELKETDFTVCFQSRLGKKPWMQPYTAQVIQKLAKAGKKRILVFCPSFVTDCLETLYEINMEYKEEFIAAGGEHLQLVEGLNDSPLFIKALKSLIV